jgi:esterase/lipase superfamily enzyme
MKTYQLLLFIPLFFINCSTNKYTVHTKELKLINKHSNIYYNKNTHILVDILYGTDRKKSNTNTINNKYTGKRGNLLYGVAQVSIPLNHKNGEMERPGIFEVEKIGKHVMLYSISDLNKESFSTILKSKIKNIKEKDILIFIHGFNVTFDSAIRRTAQLSYDLNFKGIPITYSWPSSGKIQDYMKDETSVQYTTPHLVEFLSNIIDNKSPNVNIHIIAHSMGTRSLTNALKELSFKYYGKKIFKNIILAAPDIDKDVFEVNLFPYIIKTTELMTLYASSDDSALKLSEKLHSGQRIGQGGDNIFVFNKLNTIDATGIDTSLIGHSYFAEKKLLMGDMKDIIYKSLPPEKRKSLIMKIKEKYYYWKFKY